jgi:hypothetical protein
VDAKMLFHVSAWLSPRWISFHPNDRPVNWLWLCGLVVLCWIQQSCAADSLPLMQWEELNVLGASPSPRRDAALIYDSANKKLFLFGGRTKDNVPLDDTWIFDHQTRTWESITNTQERPVRPTARYAMAYGSDFPTTSDRVGVIIAGGMGPNGQLLNDVWGFHMTVKRWAKITTKGPLPPPFLGSIGGVSPEEAATPPFSTTLYITVNSDTFALTVTGALSTYDYATANAVWSQVSTESPPSAPKDAVGTILPGEKMIFFGGCASSSCPSPAGYLASPSGSRKLVNGGLWKPIGFCPGPRTSAAITYRPDMASGKYFSHAILMGGSSPLGAAALGAPGVISYFDAEGGSWTNLLPDAAVKGKYPEQRAGSNLVSHTNLGAVVLYGGETQSGDLMSDIWLLRFQAENKLNPAQILPCYQYTKPSFFAHGLLMTFSFGFFFTGSIFFARYGKPVERRAGSGTRLNELVQGSPALRVRDYRGGNEAESKFASRSYWKWIHFAFNFIGVVLMMIGFFLTYQVKSSAMHFESTHARLGVFILSVALVQVIVGLLHPKLFSSCFKTKEEELSQPMEPAASRRTTISQALRQFNIDPNPYLGTTSDNALPSDSPKAEIRGVGGFKYKTFWRRLHQWVGYLFYFCGLMNVILGLVAESVSNAWIILWGCYLIFLISVVIVLTLTGRPNRRSTMVRFARRMQHRFRRRNRPSELNQITSGDSNAGKRQSQLERTSEFAHRTPNSTANNGPQVPSSHSDSSHEDAFDSDSSRGSEGSPPTQVLPERPRNAATRARDDEDETIGDMYDRDIMVITLPKPRLRIVNN